MDILLHKVASLVLNWSILHKEDIQEILRMKAGELKVMAHGWKNSLLTSERKSKRLGDSQALV